MKEKQRFTIFLISLRWIALLFGSFFLSLKLAGAHFEKGTLPVVQHSAIFIFVLFVFEFAISVLQWNAQENPQLGWAVVIADLLTGILVVYVWGSVFFLVATLTPLLEAFLLSDAGGILIAGVLLVTILPFIVREQFSILGNPNFTPQLAGRLLLGETLLGILITWLFLLANKQETEVTRWRKKAVDERKYLQGELDTSQSELDKLHRDFLMAQNELQALKSTMQTSLASEEEQAKTKVSEAQQREEDAVQQYNELLTELEESRKERQNLNFLVETSGHIHQSLQMDETLVTVVETLTEVLPSQTSLIFLVEDEGSNQKLFAEVAASPYADYFRNYNVEFGEGIVGWVAQSGEPAIIENGSLRTADGFEFSTLISNEKSAVAAPLVQKDGTPLGVIYLGQSQPHSYSWQDVNVLLRFTPHIQSAIAKARKYHETVTQGILDSATGLYNKTYFEERLSEEIRRCFRHKFPLSVVFLEIDGYANLAEKLDELAVRQVLKEAADLLRTYLRDSDVLARIHEGRFAILLLQSEKSDAVLISERIRLALEMRTFTQTQGIKITASIGVAGSSSLSASGLNYGQVMTELLTKAEAGLQEALAKGGNNTCMAA